MKLSVLDQSTSSNNRPHAAAIRESIELAQHCDPLGYHRYWMSEHHNSDSIVGTCGVTDPVRNGIHIRASSGARKPSDRQLTGVIDDWRPAGCGRSLPVEANA